MIGPILETVDGILAWIGSSLGQTTDFYCDLESAENRHTLVTRDGSLLSIIQLFGSTELVGPDEFDKIHTGLSNSLSSALSRAGHTFQFHFHL
jgi:intracellular multiplication protein IcmB